MLKICLNFVYFVANHRHKGVISVYYSQIHIFNIFFIYFLYSYYSFTDIWGTHLTSIF